MDELLANELTEQKVPEESKISKEKSEIVEVS